MPDILRRSPRERNRRLTRAWSSAAFRGTWHRQSIKAPPFSLKPAERVAPRTSGAERGHD